MPQRIDKDNWIQLHQSITEVAQKANRDPKEISLIAVTKTVPVSLILEAYQLGCRDFGENRVQEALEKMQQCPPSIHWHLIGTLQKNKVKKVIGKFTLIHSVDSLDLAEKISECSLSVNIQTSILLQVKTSSESTKHGLIPSEWIEQLDALKKLTGVKIEGLMTIAPLTEDENLVRNSFRLLRTTKEQITQMGLPLTHLSMGMSHDYPLAIEEGATFLRIGSALFGKRS